VLNPRSQQHGLAAPGGRGDQGDAIRALEQVEKDWAGDFPRISSLDGEGGRLHDVCRGRSHLSCHLKTWSAAEQVILSFEYPSCKN
jgi:hypothetical protein